MLRLLLPLLLLAIVSLPLRRALEEVAWEVRARQAVASELRHVAGEIVRSSVEVVDHRVHVDLIVVDDPHSALQLEQAMALHLSAATGVVPDVHATTVPNAAAVRDATRVAPEPKPEPVALPDLRGTAVRLADALASDWPADAAGALVDWHLDVDSSGISRIDVVHFGAALGHAAEQMLERDLSAAAGEPVRVLDLALPSESQSAPARDGATWFGRIVPTLDTVARFGSLYACIGVPPLPSGGDGGISEAGSAEVTRSRLTDALQRVPEGRARVVADAAWTLRVQTEACPDLGASGDGGALDDAAAISPTDAGADAARD